MYIYCSYMKKGSYHQVNLKTGRTYCKIENNSGFKYLDANSEIPPEGRHPCSMCVQLLRSGRGQKKIKKSVRLLNKSHEKSSFYHSWEWADLRYKTLLKYGAICMCCGASKDDGSIIQVDHIKPVSRYPKLKLDPDNLQVLCATCNRGKSNKDETDFRPIAYRLASAESGM